MDSLNEAVSEKCVFQTYTGRYIDALNPRCEDIVLEDIAHHLSLQCRFNGACSEFYSVAEHCFIASSIATDSLSAAALLHDAAEAYIGDMISPLKFLLPKFKEIEDGLQNVIYERFNIQLTEQDKKELKKIDLTLLATERHVLMVQDGVEWESLADSSLMVHDLIYKLDSEAAKSFFLLQAKSCGLMG